MNTQIRMNQTIILFLLVMGLLASGTMFADARNNVSGEIININYKFKTAYTDLNNEYLTIEDVVEVFVDGKFVTYLKVSETSKVISKLVQIDSGPLKSNDNFRKIRIGSSVTRSEKSVQPSTKKRIIKKEKTDRIKKQDFRTDDRNVRIDAENEELKEKFKNLSEKYVDLSSSLSRLIDERDRAKKDLLDKTDELEDKNTYIKELESENITLEEEIIQCEINSKQPKNQKDSAEVRQLKRTITELKEKLQYISNLLQKK